MYTTTTTTSTTITNTTTAAAAVTTTTTIYYHGACIFNNLPMNIKILPPKERFKAISDFYS